MGPQSVRGALRGTTDTGMTLPGPSRTIIVEPLEVPGPPTREPRKQPLPEREREDERQPVRQPKRSPGRERKRERVPA
jgi:hypothetical protein